MKALRRKDRGAARAFADRSVRAAAAGPGDEATRRWGIVLVVFMRLLACAFVAQGLVHWLAVLAPDVSLLDQATAPWGAATVVFAVLDPVAAVALWLAKPWGGVVWLFAAVAQIAAAVAIPGFFSPYWIGANGVLIGLYLVLTRLATRSLRPKRARA